MRCICRPNSAYRSGNRLYSICCHEEEAPRGKTGGAFFVYRARYGRFLIDLTCNVMMKAQP